MSSKLAEQYESEKVKQWVPCKICGGSFVPGGTRIQLPPNTDLWCFLRGKTHSRMTMLWGALKYMAQTHEPGCRCEGCKIYLAALPIMEPSATIQASET